MVTITQFPLLRLPTFLATVVVVSFVFISTGVNGADKGTLIKARSQCASVEQEIIDFESLEKQVKETKAIGVVTKLKLSNDINKLLADLKAFHAGNSPLTLEQQREQYDLLYMKIVSLVQEKDPELFNQLCNAWDPIWAELQDEKNLQTVSRQRTIASRTNFALTSVVTTFINATIPPAVAEEQLSHEDVVKQDLFIVITLHGAHCEEVIDYKKLDELDYVATCKNGNHYHVQVSPDGLVNMILQEQ